LRTSLGARPFSIIRGRVDAIVTATEAEILDAMRFVWERFKVIIEPSSAVVVAPLLTGSLPARGLKVGVIISGGNVDLDPLFQALAAKWLD
jgi:threonine dehydratase